VFHVLQEVGAEKRRGKKKEKKKKKKKRKKGPFKIGVHV
jgi:hypothetical protein